VVCNVAQGAFFASTLPPRVQGERRALVRGASRKLHLTAWTNSNTYTTGEPVQVYLQINNGTSTPVWHQPMQIDVTAYFRLKRVKMYGHFVRFWVFQK
jgi:hypothetical protein